MKRYLLLLLSLILLSSCGHVLSGGIRDRAEKDVEFSKVRVDVDSYLGKTFIWGGFIINTVVEADGTYIGVVQNPINSMGAIVDTDVSQGRFIIYSSNELDPLIYMKGRLVTVGGVLRGGQWSQIGNRRYWCPLIEAEELYVWKKDEYISTPMYHYRGGFFYSPLSTGETLYSPFYYDTP